MNSKGLTRAALSALLLVAPLPAIEAEPFVPDSDAEVLERLPAMHTDPVWRELRARRAALARRPDDLALAVEIARRYSELGRTTGDPRYAGYAQSALAPWWDLEAPPQPVRVLRAALRQRVHQFELALADLDAVLTADPGDGQARLTRATVLQVVGDYGAARADCMALQALSDALVWMTCLANVSSLTGQLNDSYHALREVVTRRASVQPAVQIWALTTLAEMAVRAGLPAEAEAHFRAALGRDRSNFYLLGAYADFLLDRDRAPEVIALLRDETRSDPLLLRYALALHAIGASETAMYIGQLADRFRASRMRGDRVHLREEARFALALRGDPETALALAKENWSVQKEPADARVLLAAATAAGDAAAVGRVRAWLDRVGLEDATLERLLTEDPSS